ncbi:bifunctional alpha,alpha-trehalose-phosphate synthase (UDP-forming)/trehalose-phosphatase [Nakamurella antarctica]|uniref:Bifunctional alpha,alpha-trehalose-phosphate synthase (UDP-forming)/trehalose-phosphatase n=1 Tax=Nakamurella antarctica TaxID=1902245 RepID=A0A3G8ZQ73_9ACTN|nr:bifunctional alpha,alpha-trehalose-phosphate synthase (UDP-forming)/trehalose-phosphatase [Nakamurella antarctica]AZI58955.1 bifunctional alpha,alpha-trehalose-phosphate synthase (UDP-forming)/trehalose-phosphatase [Nakamurella antarctica]
MSPEVNDQAAMVVVANRLPFDFEMHADGTTTAKQSPGGLVTALEPILSRREGAWIGWTGAADLELEPQKADNLSLYPIMLTAAEVKDYYEGFSNATLWPLYHDAVAESHYDRAWWHTYVAVNQRFAESAAQVAAPGATVWVHDYQLQLVPAMLRELRPDVQIGFFLHIPFPPGELFNRLPWRRQIVAGLMGADLIGFQLPGGAKNFVRLARTLLDADGKGHHLRYEGRTVKVDSFPISIDSAGLSRLAASPVVVAQAQKLRAELGNPRKIILGVDRLDYTKGINVRLAAFAELLETRDPSVDGAVMVQIATPSRERLDSYIRMREEIERQVGAINGNYGRIGSPVVHYLHQSLPRDELSAFYVIADVMTVTPLRDGMNLVAKEYVASRVDGGGVLLLSEFTGAAHELKSALMVNPYDTDGVKDSLREALTMSDSEAGRRMRLMRRQVLAHDVDRWAERYLSALEGSRNVLAKNAAHLPADVLLSVEAIADTPRLLVAVDFDGTLAPIVDDPAMAAPNPDSMVALHSLAAIAGTEVAIISGRAMAVLPELLGGDLSAFHLVGSHGAEGVAAAGSTRGSEILTPAASQRLVQLRRELQELTAEFADIRLEMKPAGVAVHLRGSDDRHAEAVTANIELGPATWPGVHVLRGKKVIELTVIGADKGQALDALRRRFRATAVIFIGDDITDEHAFATLGGSDLGVKVGPGTTTARTRIDSPETVAHLLTVLHIVREQASHRLAAGFATGSAG